MQHILFKIYNRKFSWLNTKTYNSKGKTENLKNITGISTKELTEDDFIKLAFAMCRAKVKSIRIIAVDNDLYLSLK